MAYESCFPNYPGPNDVAWISRSIYVMLGFYIILFAMTVHNSWFYLIKQKKYKIYLFACFYILVITLILSRVYYYVYQLLYFKSITDCNDVDAETAKIVSDYTRLTLGFFQCAQMIELTFRLTALHKATQTNFEAVEERLKSKILLLYKSLNVTVLVIIVIGLAFAGLLPELFSAHKTREIETFVVWYLAVTGVIYLVLAAMFVVSLVRLLRKLKQEETQTKFQAGRVKLVSTAFAVAYSFHTIIFAWATFQLYLKGVGELKDKSSQYITVSWITGQFLTIFWDIIPIFILLVIQHLNLKDRP